MAGTGSQELNITSCIFCGFSQVTAILPTGYSKRKINSIGGKLVIEGQHSGQEDISERITISPLYVTCENCERDYTLYGLDRAQDKEFTEIVLRNTFFYNEDAEKEILSSLAKLNIIKGIEMAQNIKGIAVMKEESELILYLVFDKYYLAFTKKTNKDNQLTYHIRSVFPTSRSLNGGEFL